MSNTKNWLYMHDTPENCAMFVAKVKATIIVSGVLECMTAFFFLQNLVITRKLFTSLVKSQRAVRWRNQQIANEIGVSMKDQGEARVFGLTMICSSLCCF